MNSTVVVGYDQTPSSDLALAEAAQEAARRGASLTIVTAYPWLTSPSLMARPPEAEAVVRKPAEETAQHGADLAQSWHSDLRVEILALPGYPWEALVAASETAELLVVGNRGRGGFTGLLLGSVSMRSLARAQCPVLVVRGGAHDPRRRVIAAVDLDESGGAVLEFAFAEAARRGAKLNVTSVWEEPWSTAYLHESSEIAREVAQLQHDREARLSALVERVAAGHPDVEARCNVASGSAGGILVEASDVADVVVVGAHRQRYARHHLRIGPVAQALLHHAQCSVAVVPID
jgi:nucleotide-binding universal stress UspA family protein